MTINPFDATQSELRDGFNLIEASAGTGKTYAIAMLALRFIVEQALDIKSLLIVTFTKAATEELKRRIRTRLMDARQALDGAETGIDNNLRQWLAGLSLDNKLIRHRLDMALLDFDQAAIFTIHGFCQRVLTEHALESGQLFDCELSGDISEMRQNCADDFWRGQLYALPLWQTALLTSVFTTPDRLLASINGVKTWQTVYPDDYDIDAILSEIKDARELAGQTFPAFLQKLETAFPEGMFNTSFCKTVAENSQNFRRWLTNTDHELADFSWLTSQGLLEGLNGRKFLVSKAKPLPSNRQKQDYLGGLGIECRVFDRLSESIRNLQVAFRLGLLRYLNNELDTVLQKNNIISFDELITRLAEVLCAEKGKLLIRELQLRFGAALIDEFQDTDAKQWLIFSKIFTDTNRYVYLIGDPKQSIYKFRGADIFSYFTARNQARQKFTLRHNWRSHPGIIHAVNRLFQRPRPFLLENIDFHPIEAGKSADDGEIEGMPPMVLWQLDKNPGNLEHWSAGKAESTIRNAVINETLHLLSNASLVARQERRPLQSRDIAILVRSNNQAAVYQQALQAAGIPAILNSKQSVYTAPQALEIYTVLQAVAHPGNIAALKQALTLNWFNLDGQSLYRLSNDEALMESWLTRFQEYHQLWERQGLLSMMRQLLQQEQVEKHLCGFPQTERALTNLYHILESLQQASIDGHLAIDKTLDWLRHAMQSANQNNQDEQQLRLESDEDAVRIVTLHSAKGLEYPVVFCPTLWQRNDRLRNEQNLVYCHENGEMIADLGSVRFAERRDKALQEELSEDLRLFYVAVTRAKYRCYLCWANARSKENANNSAMAYLLEIAEGDFDAQQQVLRGMAAELPDAIHYTLLNAENVIEGRYMSSVACENLTYRRRRRSLTSDWRMTSYTALSSHGLQDVTEAPMDKAMEPEAGEAVDDGLPPGVQTGNVIHALLEILNFRDIAAGNDISEIRGQAIRRYGLQIAAPGRLDQLLQSAVCTPLNRDGGFCLKDLPPERCIKEMPFYLSSQRLDTVSINNILADTPAYRPLSSNRISGYLTGFIDLICEFEGKYYVMDYKTNSLPSYHDGDLLLAMREHNYGLQFWLYSLVLDRYLHQRLPDYDYRRHFGGVRYLFLRGMNPERPGLGVFADLPGQDKLLALAEIFFGTK